MIRPPITINATGALPWALPAVDPLTIAVTVYQTLTRKAANVTDSGRRPLKCNLALGNTGRCEPAGMQFQKRQCSDLGSCLPAVATAAFA